MSDDDVCCNSGCNNCVLDIKQKQQSLNSQRNRESFANVFDESYHRFRLIARVDCTENVCRMKFRYDRSTADANGKRLFISPTHHLILRAPAAIVTDATVAAKYDKSTIGNFISRYYTPIECDSDNDTFEILVKYETNGLMSAYLRQLKIDDFTEWKGVYGTFDWQPDTMRYKFVICICQGVAIAPHFNLIQSILADADDETVIHLLACYRDLNQCLLRMELANARSYWNFHSRFYLSQQKCGECASTRTVNCTCIRSQLKFNEIVCNFRLDHDELKDFYSRLESSDTMTLLCGTDALAELVESGFKESGFNGTYYRI